MQPAEISHDKLTEIVLHFVGQTSEAEHVEFKHNLEDPIKIAKTISAITNSMTRYGIPRGYMIWGIDDEAHEIIGTQFDPATKKVGNEELLPWLSKHIQPEPRIYFQEIFINDKRLVVLIIHSYPLEMSKFNHQAFIRIGANTRPLSGYTSIEKELWSVIVSRDFESITAKPCLSKEEVEALLDYGTFYNARQNNVPVDEDILFEESIKCGLVRDNHDSTFDITNLGALLYARDIQDFPHLVGKMIRVITYEGDSKLNTIDEIRGRSGYVVEFNKILNLIMSRSIAREVIDESGTRRNEYLYPRGTIRELLGNIITHQDLQMDTIQPMVEIYSDHIEFTNGGTPLIPQDRFIDYPPQTRNLKIAEELFKVGICERRGSGWDKIVLNASKFGYSTPIPDITENTTRVVVTQKKTLGDMTTSERMWSLYSYSCLLWVDKKYLTNTDVRRLFNIPDENLSTASALISQAVRDGYIAVFDEQSGTRNRKYLPVYAKQSS